ncbi:MAG: sulfurtransferase [Oscillatoriales cyanobacterium SM2_2_1]|nr:sulfurtransferase [Oscillatoriales cyanobacterium SM2_2_1]
MGVVSAEWLWAKISADRFPRDSLVVIDCRFDLSAPTAGKVAYTEGHIPQSHYLDLNQDLSGAVGMFGGRHPLPDLAILSEKLTRIGISRGETTVVAYDDSRFAFAARLWWLLRYLGHERVALLDGGWQRWRALGYPITAEVPPKASSSPAFVPQPRPNWVVDYETVRDRPDGTILIDSREGDRYRGEREPIDPIAGHIPGAINYCWLDTTDGQGILRPDHGDRWSRLPTKNPPMVYCGSGVTACVNLLSLHLAGIDQAQLYAGSWSDWCAHLG